MNQHRTSCRRVGVAGLTAAGLLAVAASLAGCSGGYTALSPGSEMPGLGAIEWANDAAPRDLTGKVVVIEAFATW